MYLSIPILLLAGFLLYKIGQNTGKKQGREEMEDELLSDPERYNRMRYDLEPDELD